MTPTAAVVKDKTPGTPVAPGRLPPEERFWKHYSPHHEFPLSSVTSAALHALAIVLLLLSAWVAWKLGFGDLDKPVPVSAVAIEDGGGGGNPNGVGSGPNHGDGAPAEDTGNPDKPKPPTPAVNLPDLPVGEIDPVQLPDYKDSTTGTRIIDRGNKVLEQLGKIDKAAREKMFSGLGRGGPGVGGGEGHGNGPGTGDGQGPGNGGTLTKRQKRLLRWSMLFNTQSGDDYARQLQNIKPGSGAILAYPMGDGREYRVIRDLAKRPAVGQVEDIRKIKSIFWIDDRPESVAGLARALQVPAPSHFVAFFPPELEAELARIEHEYKNLNEEQIEETKFEVMPTRDGYQARVVFQSAKR
jgi:hypothetical protein